MYINLIKRKIDRFTASRRRVDAQKLNRAFAVYVCMSYIVITCVNQQTEEKSAKMLKRARQESVIIMTQQTLCNHHFIKHLSHETRLQTSSSLLLSDLH